MKIGIKLADGSFYPILTEREGARVQKKLELQAVRKGQPSAQIDFYRNSGNSMATAVCIGTLVVEKLTGSEKSAVIDLKVAMLEDGSIEAEAEERGSGVKQKLEIASSSDTQGGALDYVEIMSEDEGESAVLVKKRELKVVLPFIAVSFLLLAAAVFVLVMFLTCKTTGNTVAPPPPPPPCCGRGAPRSAPCARARSNCRAAPSPVGRAREGYSACARRSCYAAP